MSHRAALDVVASVLGLLVGLFIAFRGYRLARSFAGLAGFVVGFAVGLVVGIPGGPVGSLVLAVVLGVAFALLFLFAFRFVGAALGGVLAYTIAVAFGFPTWLVVVLVLVGIGVGVVLNKAMLIGATALLGASLATRSTLELLHDAGVALPWDAALTEAVATVALAILAAIAQWRGLRGED